MRLRSVPSVHILNHIPLLKSTPIFLFSMGVPSMRWSTLHENTSYLWNSTILLLLLLKYPYLEVPEITKIFHSCKQKPKNGSLILKQPLPLPLDWSTQPLTGPHLGNCTSRKKMRMGMP